MNLALKMPSRLDVLRLFLVSRVLTRRLLKFCGEEGVASLMSGLGTFDFDTLSRRLETELGFRIDDPVRVRMVMTLLDFLSECGLVRSGEGGVYSYVPEVVNPDGLTLKPEEEALLQRFFAGSVRFFHGRIGQAGGFLRGGAGCGFSAESEGLWDEFLGNYEFSVMRGILLKLISIGDRKGCRVLDLCYGLGHGVEAILSEFPDAKVTALDFRDVYKGAAASKAERLGWRLNAGGGGPLSVEWNTSWQGFGKPLPFEDGSFDAVHFTCADPYIPPHLREGVYSEVFRVLSPGGTLGVLTWAYPERGRGDGVNPWVRRQILAHDFAESVCEGWSGFYGLESSRRMLSGIGFRPRRSPILDDPALESSLWVLER